ncbi:cation transporter [Pseudarthrobacter albicanus]|uniref:cation transporter n=1 Tax=Pseudarthrobacter albicanus TaxID=2823873 RepID=UPI0035568CB9
MSTQHDPHEHATDHGHDHHDHDQGSGHSHEHATGIKGFLYGLFVPHTHDAADAIDDALEASSQGIRAVKNSLFILLGTTIVQFLVVLISGSVALLADTIHNFSDALTAVPLWIAFILARRHRGRRGHGLHLEPHHAETLRPPCLPTAKRGPVSHQPPTTTQTDGNILICGSECA